jgi:hypothetical protein
VATRANDQSRYVVLSEEAVLRVPLDRRDQKVKTFATGGFEIYRAQIGKNECVNYLVEGDGGSMEFSVSAATALEFLPQTQEHFPCREMPFRGEEDRPPINMVVPIT